jgi:7-cyano-7-deazaguanine synthase
MSIKRASETGLLLSGGLDSCILLAHLLDAGRTVRPIYIRTGVAWQAEEWGSVRRFLGAVRTSQLRDLVSLELPLDDLYGNHWSMTGLGVPSLGTSDESVYLPGRNPLLLIKAAVWCQMHGIEELALATLASNPFADATEDFFAAFERAVTLAGTAPLRISRPFATRSKREVMELGREYPLEHTFSCIAPHDELHCGECNKCGERKAAFKTAGLTDPTSYATHNGSISPQPLLTPDP